MADLRSSPARSAAARKRTALAAFVVAVLAGLWFLLRWSGPEPERASTAPGATARVIGSADASDVGAAGSSAKTSDVRQSIASDLALRWNIHALDAATREPISGARVRLTARDGEVEGTSDASGSLVLETEDRSESDLVVEHPAYVTAHVPALRAREPHDVLLARAGEIRGRFEPATSAPATVSLYEQVSEDERNWPVRHAASDEHGAFHFGQLATADYTITAKVEGYAAPTLHSVRVIGGETREVVMSLAREAVLRGRLLSNGTQLPIESALVSISETDKRKVSLGETAVAPVVTRSDGRFEFLALTPRSYTLVFRPREGTPFRRSLAVHEDGERIDQDFLTPPKMRYHGRAVDSEKKPVADATIILVSETEWQDVLATGSQSLKPEGRRSARSRSDGTFEIEAQFDAGGSVIVYRRGAESAAQGLGFVSAGDSAPHGATHEDLGDILILGVRTIRGLVKDDRGPVPQAIVEWSRGIPPQIVSTTTCGDDGSFSIAAPEYQEAMGWASRLSARAPGYASDRVPVDKPITDPIELMLRPIRTVSGRVIDVDGRAVANIPVVLGTQLPNHRRGPRLGGGDAVEHTDANGRFRFADVECMESEITLDSNVLGDWTMVSREPTTIAPDGDREVNVVARHVVADERASVHGRLVMPKGLEALSNLDIKVLPQKKDSDEPVRDAYPWNSKKSGILERAGDAFTLENMSPGRVVLMIDSRECLPIRRPLELRPGESFDVGDIELVRAARLNLYLVDAKDQPILGATIDLSPVEPTATTLSIDDFNSGYFSVDRALCGRSYDLHVHRPNVADYVQRIEVPFEARVKLTIRVE